MPTRHAGNDGYVQAAWKETIVTLMFPNGCRRFDQERQGIRFVAYDGMFEVPFLVEAAALVDGHPTASEESCLAAFDAARASIRATALKVYKGRRSTIYVIGVADLA